MSRFTSDHKSKLEAELAKARKENLEVVQNAIAMRRMQAEIDRLKNPTIQAAEIARTDQEESIKVLNKLIDQCAAIPAAIPIYSKATRENRKWNASKQYELGLTMAALTELISGIRFAAKEHHREMLAITGLDEVLIEDFSTALGVLPYFNPTYGVIVEGTPANEAALNEVTGAIASRLGITVERTKLTATSLQARQDKAVRNAKAKLAEYQSTMSLNDGKVVI